MEALLASIAKNIFVIFGLLAVGGATAMVASRSAVHSVLAFLFAMLNIAGCFLALGAEFLGMAQILVYAGGIVVLFLFVVMLVEMAKGKETNKAVFTAQAKVAAPVVVAGAFAFLAVFKDTVFGASAAQALTLKPGLAEGLDVARNNAQAVSRGLFADYLLPFEVLSVILLVALVGAVVLAKTERV
ncbi:MAG: NADH-quinone oxidoreductase subunit J [Holophagaceae bacterium]|nr:NADH-quinone oxidoreductase subunit J [Holophagaceae bacterium]